MVKRIKQTLADERGATLLMALFAVLLATMVCIVILGAATSSVKQEHAERAALQDEITLKSAGTMLADNMTSKKTKCTYTVTTVTTVDEQGKTNTRMTKDADVSSNCLFDSLLEPQLKSILVDGVTAPLEGTFSIKAESGAVGAAESGVSEEQAHEQYTSNVEVTYVIASDFSITFTMSLMDGDNPKEEMFLKVKTRESDPKKTYPETDTEVVTTTYTWTDPYMYRAGDEQR